MVHGLEAEYYGRIGFVYLDRDDPATESFRRHFGYVYQPEFYLVDGDGNLLMKWVGFVPQEEFEAAFEKALGQ